VRIFDFIVRTEIKRIHRKRPFARWSRFIIWRGGVWKLDVKYCGTEEEMDARAAMVTGDNPAAK